MPHTTNAPTATTTLATNATLPPPLLLSTVQLAKMLGGCSTRTVWRMLKAGQLPQPIHFNRKLVKWRYDEVHAFLANMK